MIDCYKDCKDLRNGVCPPMKMFCPKKLAEHDKQIRADAIEEAKQKQRVIIDEDGVMYKVVFLKDLEKMQKGAENGTS